MDLQLIDVTLRDGGYQTDFNFDEKTLKHIVQSIDQSGVEFIEVGYRNGPAIKTKNIGLSGFCTKEYLLKCLKLIKNVKLCVMLHPSNVSFTDLKILKECNVELCRVCISPQNYFDAIKTIREALSIGLKVSANITHISKYQEQKLDEIVYNLSQLDLNVIYFADSNGALKPNQVESLFLKYSKKCQKPLGFHAHDNLGLSVINSVKAIESGATFIDASLAGIGKGIGNLKLEFFIAYLATIGINKYNLESILSISNWIKRFKSDLTIEQFLMGIKNLSIKEIMNCEPIT